MRKSLLAVETGLAVVLAAGCTSTGVAHETKPSAQIDHATRANASPSLLANHDQARVVEKVINPPALRRLGGSTLERLVAVTYRKSEIEYLSSGSVVASIWYATGRNQVYPVVLSFECQSQNGDIMLAQQTPATLASDGETHVDEIDASTDLIPGLSQKLMCKAGAVPESYFQTLAQGN